MKDYFFCISVEFVCAYYTSANVSKVTIVGSMGLVWKASLASSAIMS